MSEIEARLAFFKWYARGYGERADLTDPNVYAQYLAFKAGLTWQNSSNSPTS